MATVLFDSNMAGEAFCAARFLKPFPSTMFRVLRCKDAFCVNSP